LLKAVKDFLFPVETVPSAAGRVVDIEILRDGVFPRADRPANKGDVVCCDVEAAKVLIERGHAKRI